MRELVRNWAKPGLTLLTSLRMPTSDRSLKNLLVINIIYRIHIPSSKFLTPLHYITLYHCHRPATCLSLRLGIDELLALAKVSEPLDFLLPLVHLTTLILYALILNFKHEYLGLLGKVLSIEFA